MFVLLFHLLATASFAANDCKWCIDNDSKTVAAIEKLAKLPPPQMLKSVRDSGVCVKILNSGRKVPANTFHWGSIESPSGALTEITQKGALMGKTLCQGEHDFSRKCMTIALASDAPKSTLIHEYLHTIQIKRDASWCDVSKASWKPEHLSESETRANQRSFLDREWDVHKFLWSNRKKLKLDLDDEIAIAANTVEQAQARATFDSTALQFVETQKISQELQKLIQQYQQLHR